MAHPIKPHDSRNLRLSTLCICKQMSGTIGLWQDSTRFEGQVEGYLFGRVSEERDELISYSLLNNTAEGYHLRLI